MWSRSNRSDRLNALLPLVQLSAIALREVIGSRGCVEESCAARLTRGTRELTFDFAITTHRSRLVMRRELRSNCYLLSSEQLPEFATDTSQAVALTASPESECTASAPLSALLCFPEIK